MGRMNRRTMLGAGAMTMAGLVPAVALGANQPAVAQPGQPLNITVTTSAPSRDVSLVLGPRAAKVVPVRQGCTHTGGGNIDVQSPTADTIVITMSGVAVAYGAPGCPGFAGLEFDLNQAFEVSFDNPKVKTAKLHAEGRVIGFLRSHKHGSAEICGAVATVTPSGVVGAPAGAGGLVHIAMPSHTVGAGENISINDKEGPVSCVVSAGKYCVSQHFKLSATMPKTAFPGKAPSAEFADGALDPVWISYKEPFKGAKKADLGFQITLTVKADEMAEEEKK